MKMYHKVSNNHDHHVENDAHGHPSHLHAVPHGVYPLPTKHSEHNEEWMEEVTHVPPGQHAVAGYSTHTIPVAFSKQLHAHYSEDEHDDGQHQGQVAQSSNRITNNFDQGVKSGPRFCQLEDSQLLKTKQKKNKNRKAKQVRPHFSSPKLHQMFCTLTSLNDRRTDMPTTSAKNSSIKLKVTMIPSKMFHPVWK